VGGLVPDGGLDRGIVEGEIEASDPTRTWLRWDGEVPDARQVMRDSWVVAVPSIRPDPFPNVVLEAMSEGRAVVASRIGGVPEMIEDGADGVLVEPGDANALAHAMARFLADRALVERVGAAAHARAMADFDTERFRLAWTARLRLLRS
jgi:glycosyltransferase involved in cell wall biosynthesis